MENFAQLLSLEENSPFAILQDLNFFFSKKEEKVWFSPCN